MPLSYYLLKLPQQVNGFPNKGRFVTNVPAKNWMANYMQSPLYRQRLGIQGITQFPSIQHVLNAHITTNNNSVGGSAYSGDKKGIAQVNIDNTNNQDLVNLYKKEVNPNLKSKSEDILSHELSHVQRIVTPAEQQLFISNNRSKDGKILNNQYKYFAQPNQSYTDYLVKSGLYDSKQGHDSDPRENKADLDAFRYMMFKNKIYDTSKRNMTMDDYKKAAEHPEIKKSVIFNRLKQAFKPEDIIKLNNTIAMNNNNDNLKNLV